MKKFGALMLMLGLCGAAATQAAPPQQALRMTTAPWKVAGIDLGMTPVEVAATMKSAGYVAAGRSMSSSWESHVAFQARLTRGLRVADGPEALGAEDFTKGQERISVRYAAGRAGPYVKQVIYKIRIAEIEADRFRSAVVNRYGAPTRAWEKELHYCVAREPNCDTPFPFYQPRLPSLIVWISDGMSRTLELTQGRVADDEFERAIAAEVDRRYPKKDRPSF